MKTKIKSYSFWTGLSAAVILLINSLGNMFGFAIEDKLVSNIIMSICGVLVVFGVVNVPTKEEKVEGLIEEGKEDETNVETQVSNKNDTEDLKK